MSQILDVSTKLAFAKSCSGKESGQRAANKPCPSPRAPGTCHPEFPDGLSYLSVGSSSFIIFLLATLTINGLLQNLDY